MQRVDIVFNFLGAMRRVSVDGQKDRALLAVCQTLEKVDEHGCTQPPRTIIKRGSPRGLTADIMYTLNRCPVTVTTGDSSFGAQVVPL